MNLLQPLMQLLSGSSEAIVFHFPVHVLTPGLLAHPAASTAALNQLKGRQVFGLVFQGHEGARP